MQKKFDEEDDDYGQSFVVCVLHSCLSSEGESGRRKEREREREFGCQQKRRRDEERRGSSPLACH
jgi:hypothetical protein